MPFPTADDGAQMREELVGAIRAYWMTHGYAPSVRDLVANTRAYTTSHVRHHLLLLRDEGRVSFTDGQARTLTLHGQRTIFE
jgi:SOS-response transcriptional repressor LexA